MIISANSVFASNFSQIPSNFICLTIFVTLKFLTQFQLKIRATNKQKILRFTLLDNYIPDLLTEVQICVESLPSLVYDAFLKDKVNSSQNITDFNN